MTPPTVVIFMSFTVPRTGDVTAVRVTRSWPANSDWEIDFSSARVLFNSLEDSVLAVSRISTMRCSASCWADCRRGMAVRMVRISPSRSDRSEEHTSELQSLMRISYAVFCLKKKKISAKHDKTTVSIRKNPGNNYKTATGITMSEHNHNY